MNFYFLVKTAISPLTVTTFFRNLSKIFIPSEVCSQELIELIWESTKVTHLEGSLKLPEDAQTELDTPFISDPRGPSISM